MLEIADSIELPRLPVQRLSRVRDLLYLDGPLLSQFVHPSGDQYLFHWCETDGLAHRWMLLRVDESLIFRMRYRFVSMDYVIPRGSKDDFVYFVDVGNTGGQTVYQTPIPSIPTTYLPQRGVLLHEDSDDDSDVLTLLIDDGWDGLELFQFPRLFELIYSFEYAFEGRQVEYLRSFPWRGGFSSVHFDSWISAAIPYEQRLHTQSVMYASPGFIQFSANHDVAESVCDVIRHFANNINEVRKAERLVASYLSDKGLKDIPEGDPSWVEHDQVIQERLRYMLEITRAPSSYELLMSVSSSTYEAAQVARWYYRRVMQAAKSVREGTIKLPPADI